MDCEFCAEFVHSEDGGRIIHRQGNWLLLPTLGCFVAGYCLVMPVEHREAVAELAEAELARLQDLLEGVRRVISGVYGQVLVAEHGPGGCDLGASCCSHAHLHCIPIGPRGDAVVAAYEGVGGPPVVLSDLADLSSFAGRAYMYLSPSPQTRLVWPASGFPRQFVRRVCAGLLGVGDRWDWRDHPFIEQMGHTLTRLRAAVGRDSGQWEPS
jgi:diadenosine tetraphosphate (Ap4A) HIT family hydrolase